MGGCCGSGESGTRNDRRKKDIGIFMSLFRSSFIHVVRVSGCGWWAAARFCILKRDQFRRNWNDFTARTDGFDQNGFEEWKNGMGRVCIGRNITSVCHSYDLPVGSDMLCRVGFIFG